jgi:hypothetical protein
MDADGLTDPEIPAARPGLELDEAREAIRFGPEETLGGFDLESVLTDLADVRSRVRAPVDAVALVREGRQELEQRGSPHDEP